MRPRLEALVIFKKIKQLLIVWFSFQYKLCRIKRVAVGAKGIPYCVTHDGRTIRYPDPVLSVHDTVRLDIKTGKIQDYIKFDNGNLAMIIGGRNMGRVGIITHREKHAGNEKTGASLSESQKYYFLYGYHLTKKMNKLCVDKNT